jgi:hypothetical protein
MTYYRGGKVASVLVELLCPEHGLERFKVKVIRKYNIDPDALAPKFRTRPKYELSAIIIGRNVKFNEVKGYLFEYFNSAGLVDRIVRVRFLL